MTESTKRNPPEYTSIKIPKSFVREFFTKKEQNLYRSFSEFTLECVRNRLKELKPE